MFSLIACWVFDWRYRFVVLIVGLGLPVGSGFCCLGFGLCLFVGLFIWFDLFTVGLGLLCVCLVCLLFNLVC